MAVNLMLQEASNALGHARLGGEAAGGLIHTRWAGK